MHWKAVQSPGYFSDRDRVVKVWDIRQGSLITSIEHTSGAQPVTGVVLSLNGSHLLTASLGYLRLWNVSTRELTHELEAHGRSISPILFSPNETHVVSVGEADKQVTIWDVDTLELAYGPYGNICNNNIELGVVAMSPSGDKLAMGFKDGIIIVMDLKTRNSPVLIRSLKATRPGRLRLPSHPMANR